MALPYLDLYNAGSIYGFGEALEPAIAGEAPGKQIGANCSANERTRKLALPA